MSQHKLVLIDGHALAYRMFFALPLEAFTTKTGEPTNATYGFTRTLLDLVLSNNPPHYLAVSFDKGATFRDEIFERIQRDTREKMPDELRIQIERIKEVVRALNIPVLELDGYEADDVLGTVAQQAKAHGCRSTSSPATGTCCNWWMSTSIELPTRGNRPPEIFADDESVTGYFGVRPVWCGLQGAGGRYQRQYSGD
jgi:DNA polymerase I